MNNTPELRDPMDLAFALLRKISFAIHSARSFSTVSNLPNPTLALDAILEIWEGSGNTVSIALSASENGEVRPMLAEIDTAVESIYSLGLQVDPTVQIIERSMERLMAGVVDTDRTRTGLPSPQVPIILGLVPIHKLARLIGEASEPLPESILTQIHPAQRQIWGAIKKIFEVLCAVDLSAFDFGEAEGV